MVELAGQAGPCHL